MGEHKEGFRARLEAVLLEEMRTSVSCTSASICAGRGLENRGQEGKKGSILARSCRSEDASEDELRSERQPSSWLS